jgi:hypothetical protein
VLEGGAARVTGGHKAEKKTDGKFCGRIGQNNHNVRIGKKMSSGNW